MGTVSHFDRIQYILSHIRAMIRDREVRIAKQRAKKHLEEFLASDIGHQATMAWEACQSIFRSDAYRASMPTSSRCSLRPGESNVDLPCRIEEHLYLFYLDLLDAFVDVEIFNQGEQALLSAPVDSDLTSITDFIQETIDEILKQEEKKL